MQTGEDDGWGESE